MFRKVLVANRGEIACRVGKTLQEMGIAYVAVYSDYDRLSPHVLMADEAYHLEGSTAAETYLNVSQLMAICQSAKIDAVHPGYGFLSENAAFAKACSDTGVVFIGPSPDVIASMGDKIVAKTAMQKAGVPVVPGWSGDASDLASASKAALDMGYPVLVKAAAGGGGKGMRLVEDPGALPAALEGASREALKAFGDGRVFIEKYITRPRHIEFQILGDTHGNVVHLFERECSIQRRHQKIVEESPSVALTPELRQKMGDAAVAAAKAIGYTNAGTVEFITDASGGFYFLEVNTRLQVEHPVTELVTHQDLVRLQLLVAAGKPLPFQQSDLTQDGHAIECRVYAEDPQNSFLPSTGTLHVYREPSGPGIRVDGGVRESGEVSVHYDPMLSKLIVWAKTRDEAIEKLRWALAHYAVLGVTTNIRFLHALVGHEAFCAGDTDTHFLTRFPVESFFKPSSSDESTMAIAALVSATQPQSTARRSGAQDVPEGFPEPWQLVGGWRS